MGRLRFLLGKPYLRGIEKSSSPCISSLASAGMNDLEEVIEKILEGMNHQESANDANLN